MSIDWTGEHRAFVIESFFKTAKPVMTKKNLQLQVTMMKTSGQRKKIGTKTGRKIAV